MLAASLLLFQEQPQPQPPRFLQQTGGRSRLQEIAARSAADLRLQDFEREIFGEHVSDREHAARELRAIIALVHPDRPYDVTSAHEATARLNALRNAIAGDNGTSGRELADTPMLTGSPHASPLAIGGAVAVFVLLGPLALGAVLLAYVATRSRSATPRGRA